jgi:hypothetical protein
MGIPSAKGAVLLAAFAGAAVGQTAAELVKLGDPAQGEAAEIALVARGAGAVPLLAKYFAEVDTGDPHELDRLRAALRVVDLLGPLAEPLAPTLADMAKARSLQVLVELAWARGSIEPWAKDQTWFKAFHLSIPGQDDDGMPRSMTAFTRQCKRLGVQAGAGAAELVHELQENEIFVREAIADVLGQQRAAEAYEPLHTMLLDRDRRPKGWDQLQFNGFAVPWDDRFRWRAGEAMLRIAPDDPRSLIAWACRALWHPHRAVRLEALRRVGAGGTAGGDAAPEIEQLARGPDAQLAVEALKVLGMLGPAAKASLPAVEALTRAADPAVQQRARTLAAQLRAMGAVLPPPAAPDERAAQIAQAVADLGVAGREEAARTALRAAGAAALPALLARMHADGDKTPASLLQLLVEAVRAEPAATREDVRNKVMARSGWQWSAPTMSTSRGGGTFDEAQRELYSQLTVGEPEPLSLLLKFFEHDNAYVRLCAVQQLERRTAALGADDAAAAVAALLAAAAGEHPKKASFAVGQHATHEFSGDLDDRIHAAARKALTAAATSSVDAVRTAAAAALQQLGAGH